MSTSVEHVIALVAKLEDRASKGLDLIGATSERTAQRVERANVQASAAVDRTDKVIDKLGKTAQQTEQKVQQLGTGSAAALEQAAASGATIGAVIGTVLGGGINFAIRGLAQMVVGTAALARQASELKTFAASMGMSVDEAQRFGFVAERFNVPIQAMAVGMRFLATAVSRGAPALRDLGIATHDANGNLVSTHDLVLELAERFHNATDETAKLTVATALLGEQGRYLVPALNQGADALKKVEDQATSTGRKIDDDAIASLVRFDTMLRNIADKWSGFTIKVRVAIVRALGGADNAPSQAALDAVQWANLQAEARAKLFPQQFTFDPRTRMASGAQSELNDADKLRVNIEASRMLTEQQKAQAGAQDAANKAMQDAADKTDRAAAAAKKFESQLQALTERLTSRDMSTAQIDALAEAFNRGGESARSLLEKLNTSDAVMKVIDRARFLAELAKQYGDQWKMVDLLTRQHTDHLGTTEQKMRAVREEMAKLLVATKEETKHLEGIWKKLPKGQTLSPDGQVQVPGLPRLTPGLIPGRVFERIGDQLTNAGGDAILGAIDKINSAIDAGVDRWTAKFIAFKGVFGDIMRFVLDEALRTFAKILALRLESSILGAFAGAAAGGVPSIIPVFPHFGASPGGGAQEAGLSRVGASASRSVPRGTTVNLTVNALDLGTVADRTRSPFGAIRLALEDALDSGRS